MRFIPTKVHGVLDYLVGIALIAAPWLFGFAAVGGAAVVIPIVLGVGLIVYSLFTKYEWGPFGVIPMPVHLVFDVVASAFLALSPWLFGFADAALNVWLPHVVVGATVILVVLLSKPTPETIRGDAAARGSLA
ncbi:SPW repeat protein [Microbacterium sp. YJN-G]|uniref:SPW repeat domain-containing protein n=1 Tax=Microbacterium sp. YJN-G TaxID=2763257 RepID=UPI001877A7C8|nr:SPW repeat protein [Microbacterium sp. YJN-G]